MEPKNKITSIFCIKSIPVFVAVVCFSAIASAQTSNYFRINSGVEHIGSRD